MSREFSHVQFIMLLPFKPVFNLVMLSSLDPLVLSKIMQDKKFARWLYCKMSLDVVYY